jgi:hypothetical protein
LRSELVTAIRKPLCYLTTPGGTTTTVRSELVGTGTLLREVEAESNERRGYD